MPEVNLRDLVRAAARVEAICQSLDLIHCVIGGLAVQHWGEPRQTNDVDASIWTEFGNEAGVIDRLLQMFSPRIADAAGFALINRVLLVHEPGGIETDIALAAFPLEREIIERATPQRLMDDEPAIRICDASDLVILKAFANRPRDWQDIRGILIRSAGRMDWMRIRGEVTMLADLKEEPEIVHQLEKLKLELTSK
jgi:hypothetical protein